MRVLITRKLSDRSVFNEILSSKGMEVEGVPFIRIDPEPVRELPGAEWIFFSSANAARSLMEQEVDISNYRVGAVGRGTTHFLESKGVHVEFVGRGGNIPRVATDFAEIAGTRTVLFPISDKSRRSIQQELDPEQVVDVVAYTTTIVPREVDQFDAVVFTSPSNVKGFFQSNELNGAHAIAIGKTTQEALKKLGIEASTPAQPTERDLAKCVLLLR